MRARYYDSQLGRFISRDPIGIADDVNLYSYVGNSPVMKVDLLGLWGVSMNDVKGSLNTAVDYVNREKENIKYMGARASCKVKQLIADTGDKVAEYTDYLLDSIDLYDMLEKGGKRAIILGTYISASTAQACITTSSVTISCASVALLGGPAVSICGPTAITAGASCTTTGIGAVIAGLGYYAMDVGKDGKDNGVNNGSGGSGKLQDSDTILSDKKRFTKTGRQYDGANIYYDKSTRRYYYRDQLHKGAGSELEVFDKQYKHIGVADPYTGKIDYTKAVKGRTIKNIMK